MSKLFLHVGGAFADDARRVVAAVRQAEQGLPIEPETHVSFENWPTFFRIMTPDRVEMLRHIHAHEPHSIRGLAAGLKRDYRRVHDDVVALERAGLIERHGTALSTGWDVDHTEIEAA